MPMLNVSRIALVAGLLPLPVFAHPGHIVAEAGHNHWVAGAAIAAAAGIALWAAWKGRKSRDADDEADEAGEAESDDAPQEA